MEMFVSRLLSLWEKLPVFLKLCEDIKKGRKYIHLTGLWGGARAFFICGLQDKLKRGILVATKNVQEAEKLKQDIISFHLNKEKVFLFPSENKYQRLQTLAGILKDPPPILITYFPALKQNTISSLKFSSYSFKIEIGQKILREEIIRKIIEGQYERVELTEEIGQFSLRGEIIDIWPPDYNFPLRMLLCEDKVEKITEFEVSTQRSKTKLKELHVIPAKELEEVKIFDYLLEDSLIFIDDCFFEKDDLEIPRNYTILEFSSLPQKSSVIFPSHPMINFAKSAEIFYREKKKWNKQGLKVFIFCNNEGERERMEELIYEREKTLEKSEIVIGPLNEGFIFPDLKIVVVTDNEIFNRYKVKHYFPKVKRSFSLNGFYELNHGDYVVHEKYGIGRYLGLNCLHIEGGEKDFLTLEYAGGDKLYVPVEDFSLVQKYVGTDGYRPRIYPLDGISWVRVKERVKKKVYRIAKNFLHLYAIRQTITGHAFLEDTPYEDEFSKSFIYEETPDQRQAIEEVKKDMQLTRPMDRLICGDVGYGKTEIAMRASFKAVLDNKQVAILVPTTVLAEQHFNTFQERFRDYPVITQMLSRFRTRKEQKQIIQELKEGKIDIIIGTHRLLQKDIKFKNLGLLIIDEEQRFGVKDKERLKEIRSTIDVLTLSATPIPRTLSIALEGIREMSIVNTPPWGRLPVWTYVGKYNEEIIEKSISAEIKRGGQVFFVHNRIESIASVAGHLKELLPQINIGIAHGKMKSRELERVMVEFLNKKYDILLSTTIIEAGLDIPNVNTMIINHAEEFGLAQLYQLRGRIGRDRYQAYVYLFYPDEKILSPEAKKRLEAIAEFTELGSGFKIALRDLEIRGAGNILGCEQHGNIMEIGLELYCRLLSQTLKNMKGEDTKELPQPKIDISLNVHIPSNYISDANQRIIIYRRMMNISEEGELRRLKEELHDRFGKPPRKMRNLFRMIDLRILSQKLNISEIKKEKNYLFIKFLPQAQIEPEKILKLTEDFSQKGINFLQKDFFAIKIKINAFIVEDELIDFLKKILQRIS